MSTLTEKIEAILRPAVDVRAPYARQMVQELALLIGTAPAPESDAITDAQRLDFIEAWARRSPTGVSIDKPPTVDGERGGFRFMRRHYIGGARDSLRAVLDAEIRRDRESVAGRAS